MLIVHVHIRVKPEFVEQFKETTIENARNSVREPASPGSTSCGGKTIPHASC